jgi:thiamine-phosphate pyrophosphorylase
MPLEPSQHHPLMCLTQDGLAWSHAEQAERLCAAGAKWIQLRMKGAPRDVWEATAAQVVAICRKHGAVCIINDSVDVALAVDADGVHVNWRDEDWSRARERLGPTRILGGTVNTTDDARRAVAVRCLDYVGVGPWRFTTTKQKLAPVLGAAGVRELILQLDGLPAWAIGGITADDLPEAQRTGAAGVAITGALYRDGHIEENVRHLLRAWPAPRAAPTS